MAGKMSILTSMATATRAIVIENDKLLVMQRNKFGSTYFTLVGGRINHGETPEEGLAREVFEETGLTVTSARPVFIEQHPEPYDHQIIYLCEVAPHQDVVIQETSEEATMNKYGMNLHQPFWVTSRAFAGIPFRTPLLHKAIVDALKKGFPKEPIQLQETTKSSFLKRTKKQFKKWRT